MSTFLTKLPLEVRLQIYAYLFDPYECRALNQHGEKSYDFSKVLQMLLVNRQIYTEARKVFREENLFMKVQSPWPQMKEHVREKQHVPIVCCDDRAEAFTSASLIMNLDAPAYPSFGTSNEQFILHQIDLEHFTKQWALADMSHNLNENLRMVLELDSPYTPSYEQKHMPKQMQRSLLLPFTNVKRLAEFRITGELRPYSAVEKELRTGQATPYKSPESCLSDANQAFMAGNAQLQAGKYKEALELYRQSWAHMHVIVDGRQREVLADQHYAVILCQEPYVGKNGQGERMALRVGLVANTCKAYLGLKEWDECRFWGERTINMVRDAIGLDENMRLAPEQEAIADMPSGPDMGRVYFRTAIANAALGDVRRSRRQARVAQVYLPGEQTVKEWITECESWMEQAPTGVLRDFTVTSSWP